MEPRAGPLAAKIGVILNELSTFGETSIRRAYGNWKKQELRGWEELLHEHAIRPMQQFDYSKGKNASDMAMVIDALDLLYSDRPEAFGIVLVHPRLHVAFNALFYSAWLGFGLIALLYLALMRKWWLKEINAWADGVDLNYSVFRDHHR